MKNDSVAVDTDNIFINYFSPNFSIPEFDSVHETYTRNDSIINSYNRYYTTMSGALDSLQKYYQDSITSTLDSLVTRRKALEK